jgi:hypothetical protein
LFQPGLFLDYLAYPHKTATHVTPLETFIDFQNRRAIVVDGHENAIMTLTTVENIAGVVGQAVDLAAEWPKIGGIRGNRVTVSQILKIGERVRGESWYTDSGRRRIVTWIAGRPFTIEKVKLDDLQAGNLKTSWTLGTRHPSFSDDQADQLAAVLKGVLIGTLISSAKGAWDVPDAFDQLLPDFNFTKIDQFLSSVWDGLP